MTASYQHKDERIAALDWQLKMGIDCALLDDAQPHAKTQILASPSVQQAATAPAADLEMPAQNLSEIISAPPQSLASPSMDAAIQCAELSSLEALKEALAGFEGSALKKTASNLVFADGNPEADIMLIGEAPGRDEDRMGLPFVGAAGQLLDRMLKSVGMDRRDVYITNILPWRPPGNRTPSPEETQLFWPFLRRHIQLKAPKIICALGGSSAKLLLNTQTGIVRLRGQIQNIDFSDGEDKSLVIPVLATLHPAYLLRAPNMKKQAFSDLLHLSEFRS